MKKVSTFKITLHALFIKTLHFVIDKDTGVTFEWNKDYNLHYAKYKTQTIHKKVKVGPSMAAKKAARHQRREARKHGKNGPIVAKGKTKTVTETQRVRVTPVVQGFDVLMDLAKREEYCKANNIPFNSELFANPGNKQKKAIKTTLEYFLHLEDPPEEADSDSSSGDSDTDTEGEGEGQETTEA